MARTPPVTFTIPGEPVGKPRMTRSDKWNKRPCVMRYRAWADAARLAAGRLPNPEEITEFRCTAYFSPPASYSRKRQEALIGKRHRVRPDFDNVIKSCADALFKNDAAIADGVVRKRWDWTPRVEVVIELEDADE